MTFVSFNSYTKGVTSRGELLALQRHLRSLTVQCFLSLLFVLLSVFSWPFHCLSFWFAASDYPFDIFKLFFTPSDLISSRKLHYHHATKSVLQDIKCKMSYFLCNIFLYRNCCCYVLHLNRQLSILSDQIKYIFTDVGNHAATFNSQIKSV